MNTRLVPRLLLTELLRVGEVVAPAQPVSVVSRVVKP